MTNRQKAYYSLSIVSFATLLVSAFWGLFFMAPSVVKIVFSLGMWMAVICFPRRLVSENDFRPWTRRLLIVLLVVGVFEILRSVFNDSVDMYTFGNKWVTIFGNEYTSFLFVPPLFCFLGSQTYGAKLICKSTYIFLLVGTVLCFTLKPALAWLCTYVGVFYPYVNKRYRFLVLVAFVELVLKAFLGENTTRMFLIILFFSLLSYMLVYVVKSKKLIKIAAIGIIASPFVLFLPMLKYVGSEETVFQKMKETILHEMGDEQLSSDTRTFLYLEMAEDLTRSESWLIGKGAYSHYYSLYFDENKLGKYGRITSEVPFLLFLLRGGVIYCLLYFGLLILAIYYSIWKGRNKFVQSIGIIICGWYFNSFVGDITGARYFHLAFFVLVGCCLSRQWLNYSDEEIVQKFKGNGKDIS